jgi:hypothetical protein
MKRFLQVMTVVFLILVFVSPYVVEQRPDDYHGSVIVAERIHARDEADRGNTGSRRSSSPEQREAQFWFVFYSCYQILALPFHRPKVGIPVLLAFGAAFLFMYRAFKADVFPDKA